ncbi:hypothetical protein ONZ45_g9249 [Pleurotus djamor]|nr:hypothetical protein ONZ45_g9249 [Pleurotus djamor]
MRPMYAFVVRSRNKPVSQKNLEYQSSAVCLRDSSTALDTIKLPQVDPSGGDGAGQAWSCGFLPDLMNDSSTLSRTVPHQLDTLSISIACADQDQRKVPSPPASILPPFTSSIAASQILPI